MSTVRQFICWFASIDWTPEAVTAASTIALAFLTLVLAVGTLFLWLATRRLVRGSEKTAKAQLRAYIFIHQGEIKLINNDTAIIADLTLKNFGATPGYDFKSWTNIRIGATDEPIFGQRKSPAQTSIIGPLSDISAPSQFIPITPDERSAINNGVKKIFVWGEAAYTDAFGTSWTFLFKATNGGLEVTNTENITGRLLWRGWASTQPGMRKIRAKPACRSRLKPMWQASR
jgi:hypothetical protein